MAGCSSSILRFTVGVCAGLGIPCRAAPHCPPFPRVTLMPARPGPSRPVPPCSSVCPLPSCGALPPTSLRHPLTSMPRALTPRPLQVSLRCGQQEKLAKVEEPSRCEYTAELETPAACTSDALEALQAELAARERLLFGTGEEEAAAEAAAAAAGKDEL